MLQGIFEVVSIPSERQEPADHAPYGKPVKEALDHVMEMAREMGFATKVIEDQVGIVQYGGNIDDCDHYLGIMGHLDVVEAKNQEGWISDPYQPEIRDGKIYARGILDNKGPILSCLYALKALKDLNIEPALPIRILLEQMKKPEWKMYQSIWPMKQNQQPALLLTANIRSFMPKEAVPYIT